MDDLSLQRIGGNCKCLIYNELSHMSPYYLAPFSELRIDYSYEERFHKRNIYLLSLYFDKIVINTENIIAFSNNITRDVITHIVGSEWFESLVQLGIVHLSGWGADLNSNVMENSIDYSMLYKKELKNKKYIQYINELSKCNQVLIRDPSACDIGHEESLIERLHGIEMHYTNYEFETFKEHTLLLYSKKKYIGTLETFPFIERCFAYDKSKRKAAFSAYYDSWQDYSSKKYAPAITVDSARVQAPARLINLGSDDQPTYVLPALYSPDFFYYFLSLLSG